MEVCQWRNSPGHSTCSEGFSLQGCDPSTFPQHPRPPSPVLNSRSRAGFHFTSLCLCQQSAKPEVEPTEESREQLPILADMVLYYCRFATRPVLLQLYQTEVRRAGPFHPTLHMGFVRTSVSA